MAKAKKQKEEKLENENDLEKENMDDASQNNEDLKDEKEDGGQAEIKNLNDRFLRLQADFLNYKARTEKEKSSTYGCAVSDLILDLLPVVDNFERALETDYPEGSSFKEGVQMVYNQFMGILNKKGLKEVEALHKPFDHNLHHGVAFEECDEYEDGIIIDVLQKGYTVNEKCIRPSMVRICRK
jgi:molecular chaperone GrpE